MVSNKVRSNNFALFLISFYQPKGLSIQQEDGGYGGGGIIPIEEPCNEVWKCSEWDSCINNQKTRTCTDKNDCGTIINKPPEIQNCVSSYGAICTSGYGSYGSDKNKYIGLMILKEDYPNQFLSSPNSSLNPDSSYWWVNRQEVLKEFYKNYEDSYDFLILFPTVRQRGHDNFVVNPELKVKLCETELT